MEDFLSNIDPRFLTAACIGVAGGSAGLLGIMAADVIQSRRAAHRRHKDKREAVSDLTIWQSVIEDGIVLNKNGSIMASWYYLGADIANVTNTERNIWSHRLNAAFKPLGGGWMLHVDSVRRPCSSYTPRGLSKFPDPVSRAMDEERRQTFVSEGAMYESCHVITVTWFPPTNMERNLSGMIYDDPDAVDEPDDLETTDKVIADFKRQITTLESNLSAVFKLQRLKSYRVQDENGETICDDQLEWLHYSLTGIQQPISLPECPRDISGLIGGHDMIGSIDVRIGNKYVRVVSLNKEIPSHSYPGMLNVLSQLSCECRWNSRFIFLDKYDSLARIEKERKNWQQKERGLIDIIFRNERANGDAVRMRQDAETMQEEVQSDAISAGYFTMNVVLMDEDHARLEKSALFVAKKAADYGFPAQIEQLNNLDAFLGTLPGHGSENIRTPIIHTLNFADIIPTSTIWMGMDECPCVFYPPQAPALAHCVTSGHTPFRLNFHVGDVGHSIVFGPTGAGKSVFLAFAAAQFLRYEGMTVYAFDKGMSMFTLCKAVGGHHYDIAGDEKRVSTPHGPVTVANYAFCPLQHLDDQNDVAWAVEWIEAMVELNGVTPTPEQSKTITTAMNLLKTNPNRSMDDFVTILNDNQLRAALHDYTSKGIMGYMLSASQDELHLDAKGGMAVFEIEELMGMSSPKYVLPVLMYLFRRVERSLRGQPAVVFLDEAWLMLDHPVFREKIREWLKVFRKKNCAVIMATQSLSDATNSGILDVIRESTSTKIFLPNPYARNDDTAAVYRRMGLNDQQIRMISDAIPKRQYYYSSEKGNRLFELALGPLQLAFMAVSDKESVALVKKLIAVHGDAGWVPEWLKIRNVDPELYWEEVVA